MDQIPTSITLEPIDVYAEDAVHPAPTSITMEPVANDAKPGASDLAGQDFSRYPSEVDAGISQGNDLPYGDNSAPFLAPRGATMKQMSIDKAVDFYNGGMVGDEGKQTPMDRDLMYDVHKAWLAARQSSIAYLGFDPRHMTISPKSDTDKMNLFGSYGYEKDNIWVDQKNPPSMVHESFHRGLQALRKAGAMDLPQGQREEDVVRALMSRHFGDVEMGHSRMREQQVRYARNTVPDALLDRIEAAAARLVARRTPRGPR